MSGFKIIVDDGFCAYEYNTSISGEYSIDDVVREINNSCSFKLGEGNLITTYDSKKEIDDLIEDKKQLLRVLNQLVVDHPELNEVIKKHS